MKDSKIFNLTDLIFRLQMDLIPEELGIGLNSSSEDEDGNEPVAGPSSRVGNVSAIPSGAGLTFLLEQDDDLDEDEAEEAALEDKRELASQFLSGDVDYKAYVREINRDDDEEDPDDDEDDDEDQDEDEEWTPKAKKRMKKFESELETTQRQQLSKKRKKNVGSRQHRRKRLDPALQGLMGEANLRFARGDKDTAVRMCMEVIRQDPMAPEPFQTLSTLYEEDEHEQEKALQFALIAAHLAPQDPEEWARLANMSHELNDFKQAAICFKKG